MGKYGEGFKAAVTCILREHGTAVVAASAPVAEPVTEASIPWYESIFRTPNLALAMGALVLAFSGILGYLVMQKQNADQSATVSQVTETEQTRGGPNFSSEADMANTTSSNAMKSAANVMAPATNTAANSSAMMPGRGPNAEPGR